MKLRLHKIAYKNIEKRRRQKTSRSSNGGLFSKIMFVLNICLSLVLIFLLLSDYVFKQDKKDEVAHPKHIFGVRNIADDTIIRQTEKDFLKTALNFDELQNYQIFQLEKSLQEKTLDVDAIVNIDEKIVHVDELNLSNEEVYKIYEEKLPDDVVEHDSKVIKKQQPMIAIVIDDMGISAKRTADISSLKYPITSSFLTYAKNLKKQISKAKDNGHEIMAHLPMEPKVMQHYIDSMLLTSMSDKEVLKTLKKMLDTIPEAKSVNNHMGSKFTEDKHRMAIVMKELSKRKIAFLDSKTTPKSAGPKQAKRFNVSLTMRNVFLDNKDDFDYITKQLHQTEEIARRNGYAIAIGHPKAQTYNALKAWLPTLKNKGIMLLHLSELSKRIEQ